MLVFAAVLGVLGVLLSANSRQALVSTIDGDLARRGNDFVHMIAHRSRRSNAGPFRPPPRQPRDRQWIAPTIIHVAPEPGEPPPNEEAYDYEAFATAVKGEPNFKTDVVDGDPRRLYSVPLRESGRVVAVVQVASSLGPALTAWNSQRLTLLRLVLPLGLILGALASLLVVERLLKPLRHLNAEAARIGQEGFGERLVPQGDDEFASLVGTLNDMLRRLEAHYRLEHQTNASLQATLEQQRRFTSDASHELKTPLTVIRAHVGILKTSRGTVAEEMESIRSIDAGASRMTELIRDLLILARTDSGAAETQSPCCLGEVIDSAIRSIPGGPEKTAFRDGVPVRVLGSEGDLTRVFINLIDNAIKHSGSVRPIEIDLTLDGNTAVASVRDHGAGIEAEHLPHLFERFYRSDQSRASDTGGSGLGLAICDQIVRRLGGEITVTSEVGTGTCFTVRLPVIAP
jgi:two-component system OmpR family sensor kinase